MTEAKRTRRTQSEMSISEAHKAFENFAKKIERIVETTTDNGTFRGDVDTTDCGKKNIQILVSGGFGVTDDLVSAVRIFNGTDLPRKE